MPKIPDRPKPKPVCKACGGTGLNSRGGPCSPCVNNAAKAKLKELEKEMICGKPKLRILDDPKLGKRFLNVGKENSP